jgi:cytochrome oxidase Cu insertion factor (SCO1/SenC/PrrC family)
MRHGLLRDVLGNFLGDFSRRHSAFAPVAVGVAVLLAAGAAVTACARALSSRRHLTAGDAAPDLEARDQAGAPVRLSQFRGRPLVVYFYPKDRTSG